VWTSVTKNARLGRKRGKGTAISPCLKKGIRSALAGPKVLIETSRGLVPESTHDRGGCESASKEVDRLRRRMSDAIKENIRGRFQSHLEEERVAGGGGERLF